MIKNRFAQKKLKEFIRIHTTKNMGKRPSVSRKMLIETQIYMKKMKVNRNSYWLVNVPARSSRNIQTFKIDGGLNTNYNNVVWDHIKS